MQDAAFGLSLQGKLHASGFTLCPISPEVLTPLVTGTCSRTQQATTHNAKFWPQPAGK